MHSILVVDDEPEIVDALVRTLRHGGYRIVSATSGEAALEVLASEKIDVVVSDIDMRGMSGLDLLARVRVTYPETVRIVLTGVTSLEGALRAINEGEVHRFLTKPWEKEAVRSAVREGLDRMESGRGLPRDPEAVAAERRLIELASQLSLRMRETLLQLLTGVHEKEIADRMGISPHTVHQYVKALYQHFDVGTRAQFMAMLLPIRDRIEKIAP